MTTDGKIKIETSEEASFFLECPICGKSDHWVRPAKATDEHEEISPVMMGQSKKSLVAMPIDMAICGNCGFILNRVIGTESGQ